MEMDRQCLLFTTDPIDAGFFVSDRVRNTFIAEAGESP
jgi:hypothetical protein